MSLQLLSTCNFYHCMVFRLAAASVMVGEFDATRFTSMVVLEGPLAKRTLSGHKSRYGVSV
jgi:hypothetical protein